MSYERVVVGGAFRARRGHGMIETAIRACKASGSILREHFDRDLKVNVREHHDVRLEVDRLCEERMKEIISSKYPDHSFLAEESGRSDRPSDYTWIIDPLDGTANYYRQIPHFAVSVALQKENEIVLGVVYDPRKDDLFTAEKNKGANLNGTALSVSKVERLEEGYISVGFMKSESSIKKGLHALEQLSGRVSKVRMTGSAALDICYVACGRFDAYIEYQVSMWDMAAGILMVEESGGQFDFELGPERGYEVLASNGKLHQELKGLVGGET